METANVKNCYSIKTNVEGGAEQLLYSKILLKIK